MTLITGSAALQAHSALATPSGAAWCGLGGGAARRSAHRPTAAGDRLRRAGGRRWPRSNGGSASKDEDLLELIDAAFVALAAGFDAESGG